MLNFISSRYFRIKKLALLLTKRTLKTIHFSEPISTGKIIKIGFNPITCSRPKSQNEPHVRCCYLGVKIRVFQMQNF